MRRRIINWVKNSLMVIGALFLFLIIIGLISETETLDDTNYNFHFEDYETKLEEEIFKLFNQERRKEGIPSLIYSEELAKLSKQKSEDMITNNYFSHIDLYGKEYGDHLKDKNIFYGAGTEILSLGPVSDNITLDASETVDGWMNSPGHRSAIIDHDNLWETAGIGVSCDYNLCYVTATFIDIAEEYKNEHLKHNYYSFYPLYSKSSGLTYPVEIEIDFYVRSSGGYLGDKFRIILVKDSSDFDKFIESKTINPVYDEVLENKYNEKITIYPGYGIILGAERGSIDYTIKINYKINDECIDIDYCYKEELNYSLIK